jgi:hypothetical protein
MALQPGCLPRNQGLKLILLAAIISSIWLFYRVVDDPVTTISSHIPPSLSPSRAAAVFPIPPSNDDVTDLCARHRLKPFTPPPSSPLLSSQDTSRQRRRKI